MEIVFEDNHLLAVNKPCGIPVQRDISGDKPLFDFAKDYIKVKYNKPGNVFLGLSHRIDRPVSGLVVFAKTSKMLSRLNSLFRADTQKIEKIYWAIVKNIPPKDSDTLIHYMKRNRKQNKSYALNKPDVNTKKASLSYELVASSTNYYLLKIILHTGRHHQIRSQLSKIGCPIKGDLKYGYSRSNKDKGIDLHASSLSFIHPVKKEKIKIVAPLPKNTLWEYFSHCM